MKKFALFLVCVVVLSVGCGSGLQAISVSLAPSAAQAIDDTQSVNITATVTNDPANKGVTWALTGPGALTNQTATTVTYTASGTGTATITATSVADATKNKPLAVTVTALPVITTASLPAGTEGTAYSQTVAVTGGAGTLAYSISLGALPPGLNLNSSTGAITGTPTGPNATANFTVKVTDSSTAGTQSATKALSILINLPPAPTITTASLPAGVEGTAYSQTLAGTCGLGPCTWSVTAGLLPVGLNLNANTGAITGTPTGPNGTANFTMTLTDKSNPAQTVSKALSILINLPPAPTITTTSLPGAVEFTAYNQTLAGTCGFGPCTWSITVGSLPAGLNLNTNTGAITGTPTGPNGTASFTVKVTDNSNPAQTATQALSIAVSLPPAPVITTTTLPNGTVATPYNQTVGLSGGHGPFTWSIILGALPSPLTLNASTGAITGSPAGTGTSNFTVQVVDSSNPPQTTSQALSISVTLGPLVVTPATLPTGAVNEAYPATSLAATGGLPPYTWSITVGALPTSLAFNTSTGAISGTPTASGTFNFTAKVTDSLSATATQTFSITINPVLAVTTASLPGGTQGTSYPSTNLSASGGITPFSWSITAGALPAGMNLSGNTISGIPTAFGSFPITVQVTDAASGTATANFTIVIAAAPPLAVTTTSGALPAGTLSTAYPSTTLSASGGIQPYTWSVVTPGTGSLPPGLTLSSSGQITGTPTSAGTYPFTAKVTDSVSGTATANLSITVAATSSCTTLTGQESLLKGDYAFVLNGFDASGNPALVGGVFVAGGVSGAGNITAGTLDMNLVGGVQSGLSFTSASTYNLGQDSTGGFRGCMTIVTSAGTQHYRFSVDGITAGTASNGHVIDFDTAGPFTTGILRQATSSAFSTGAIAGNWAFGISGARSVSSGGGKFAAAGVVTLAGGSASGVGDVNDNGTLDGNNLLTNFPATPLTLSSGPYSIASNGRGTLQFTPSGSTSAVNNIVYVVSSSEVLILNSDSQTNAAFTGRALKQSGTFSNSSLNANTTDVLYNSGLGGTAGTSRVEFGLIATTGSSANFTFSGYDNDGGSISDPATNSVSGTYSVVSDGRVTLTVSGGGGGGNNHQPVFYLSSANTAFFLSSGGDIGSGFFEPQSGSSFTNSSASGAYGIGVIDPKVSGVSDESGMLTFTPSTTSISGTTDKNSQGTLTPDNTVSAAYAINSTGVGLIPSGCTLTGSSANCENLFIVISPKKAVLMKVKPTSTTPAITVLEQ